MQTHNRFNIKSLLLIFLFAACLAAIAIPFRGGIGGDGPASPGGPPLTVEQTLGLVFARFIDSPSIHLYARANPGAKEALDRILADDSQRDSRENAWMILRYLGSEDDVDRAAEAARTILAGEIGLEERKLLSPIFESVGVMCRRDVEGACELLARWLEPSHWRSAKFRPHIAPAPGQLPPEYEIVMRAMSAYALSEPRDMRERIEALLGRIPDEGLRDLMAQYLAPAERLAARREEIREQEARIPTPGELRALEDCFNGDLANPGPRGRR